MFGKVEIFSLSKTGHCVNEEDSLVGVAAREWMSTLSIPVNIVNRVGKESGEGVFDKAVEDLSNMDSSLGLPTEDYRYGNFQDLNTLAYALL